MDNKTYFDRAKVVWQMEARSIEKLTKTVDSVSFNNVIDEIKACLKRKCRIYIVITSYSIHYTKLYELLVNPLFAEDPWRRSLRYR